MASTNFVVLRLGSFSFSLDAVNDNCSNNEAFLKAKFKFCEKVKECINTGIRLTLSSEKDLHSKSFALLKMNDNGMLFIYNKKKSMYQHQLFGLQLWNCKEISESCFALMARFDPRHKKFSENEKGYNIFGKSRNNRMIFVCHVFMTDTLISDHISHCHIASSFGIKCHFNLKSGKCFEFPSNLTEVVMGLKSHFGFKRLSDLFLDINVYSASSIGGDLFSDVVSSPSPMFWRESSSESLLTLNQAPEKFDLHLQVSLDDFLSEMNKNLWTMDSNCSRHEFSTKEASQAQIKKTSLLKRKLHDQRTPFSSTSICEERCTSTPPVFDAFSEEEEDNNKSQARRGGSKNTNNSNEKMCFYDSDSGIGASNGNRWRDWRKPNKANECIKIANVDLMRTMNIPHDTHSQSFPKERRRVSKFLKQVAVSNNMFGESLSNQSLASNYSKPPLPPSIPRRKPPIERMVSSRAATWGVSFENLFSDPLGLTLFNEFLRREFSIENMTFWKSCEDYKKMSDEQRKEEARNIYRRHFSTGAVDPINVDHEISIQVKSGLIRASPDLFDTAQKHVIYLLMKQDIYPRFKKSDIYRNSVISELEGKPHFSEGPELSEDCQKMTKRGKSLLFWQKRKLTKTNTIPDMKGINRDYHDIYRPQINEKLTLSFPDGKSLVISLKSIKASQISLREVMEMHQDKIKPGINSYEAVDPLTGQAVSLDEQLVSLCCSNLEMIRCSVFRVDLLHSKLIVKSRMGTCLGECMEPVLRMHCPGMETHVFEFACLGHRLSTDTMVDALDRQHIVVYHKDFFQASHGTGHTLSTCERLTDSLLASLGKNLDAVAFDKCITFDFRKLICADGQKFLKTEFQSSNKQKLFSLIKRNNSDRKKSQQAMRSIGPPSAHTSGSATAEMSEPAFDDDTLLDLIQSSQCRTIETQRYGALHKSMPSFLENEVVDES